VLADSGTAVVESTVVVVAVIGTSATVVAVLVVVETAGVGVVVAAVLVAELAQPASDPAAIAAGTRPSQALRTVGRLVRRRRSQRRRQGRW
jgi:hypothetical protein